MTDKTRCVVIRKTVIDESLAQTAQPGKRLLEPLKSLAATNVLPFNVLEDSHVLDNLAEVHLHESDLWHCLEGRVQFVYGGEMVDPFVKENADGTPGDKREIKAKEIKNGTEVTLESGDWLWIPAGIPHQHNCQGTARLIIIKIPIKG